MPIITLSTAGTVTNAGTYTNTYLVSPGITFVNHGLVGGSSTTRAIVVDAANDVITNTGLITGVRSSNFSNAAGIVVALPGSNATITNAGTIAAVGTSAIGIAVYATGAVVTNSGLFSSGIYFTTTASGGTLTNSGTIVGNGSYGAVAAYHGLSVTNQTGGMIDGRNSNQYGIKIKGGAGTITNTGTIAGTGNAVILTAGFANRVIEQPGGMFVGTVNGGDASQAVLELGSAASTGTLTATSSQFTNFKTLQFDSGATWQLTADATMHTAFGTIAGFTLGDGIVLSGSNAIASTTFSSGVTHVTLTGDSAQTLNFAGSFTQGFTITGAGVLETVACFRAGTRIATAIGAVAVEDLAVGTLVPTLSGRMRRVRWVGHRTLDCTSHPQPDAVMPIRVAAGAFGAGMPLRDLYLSPDHAVFIAADREGATAGALIPVRYLVNDATIAQVHHDRVSYLHVELDAHDVVLAEGLPCETYLDTGNRAAFANAPGGAVMLHADFALGMWEAAACARLVVGGATLVAARDRLLERAAACGHAMTDDPALDVVVDGRSMPVAVEGQRHRVRLPAGARTARLVSRSHVPARMLGDADDHRRLGVAVAALALDAAPAEARLGTGWHAPKGAQPGGCRWTDGGGEIDVRGAGILTFDLAMVGRYWAAAVEQQRASKRAARRLLRVPPSPP